MRKATTIPEISLASLNICRADQPMGSQAESIVTLNPLVVAKLHPTGDEWRLREKFDKSAEGSEFGKEVGELCSPGQASGLPLPLQCEGSDREVTN